VNGDAAGGTALVGKTVPLTLAARRTMTRPSRRCHQCTAIPHDHLREEHGVLQHFHHDPLYHQITDDQGSPIRRLMRHQFPHPRALTTVQLDGNSPVGVKCRRAMLRLPVRFTGFNNGSYFRKPGGDRGMDILATLCVRAPAHAQSELFVAQQVSLAPFNAIVPAVIHKATQCGGATVKTLSTTITSTTAVIP